MTAFAWTWIIHVQRRNPLLTYKQAADKLGVSAQAVRQKAIRGRWPRTKGNDGQARVQVPNNRTGTNGVDTRPMFLW